MRNSKYKRGFWFIVLVLIYHLMAGCNSNGGLDETAGSPTTPTGDEPDNTGTPENPVILPYLKGLWLAEFIPAVAFDPSNPSIQADRMLLEITEVGDVKTANLYFFYKTDQVGGQKSTCVQTADTLTLQGTKSWNSNGYWLDSTNVITVTYLYAAEYLDLGFPNPNGTINARTYKQPPFGFDTDLVHTWIWQETLPLGSLKPKDMRPTDVNLSISTGEESHTFTWDEYNAYSSGQEIFSKGTIKTMGQYLYMQWLYTGQNYDVPIDKLSLRKYSKEGSGTSMLLTVEGTYATYKLKIQ